MRTGGELVLWVDEKHVAQREVVDLATGDVNQIRVSAREFCRTNGIPYRPMTEAIKNIVLYQRKPKKDGEQPIPVQLGDLGPYVLCRVVNGTVSNGFGVHDIPKPVKLSEDTLRGLASIFNGTATEEQKG